MKSPTLEGNSSSGRENFANENDVTKSKFAVTNENDVCAVLYATWTDIILQNFSPHDSPNWLLLLLITELHIHIYFSRKISGCEFTAFLGQHSKVILSQQEA